MAALAAMAASRARSWLGMTGMAREPRVPGKAGRTELEETRLHIHEIFPSFQGEGVLVGVPQLFLRLCGCNLHCAYCDTPEARRGTEACRVRDWEGEREVVPNPVEVADVARIMSSLWDPSLHSVSVTGGEPLLQAGELARLLPLLAEEGMGVYLETNGTLYQELDGVLPWVEWVAMDVKLPSALGGRDPIHEHRLFLRRARSRRVFLKMVVDTGTGEGELVRACRVLSEEAGDLALVLQPATPMPGGEWVAVGRVAELQRVASAFFPDVRVIPQAHRAWGAR